MAEVVEEYFSEDDLMKSMIKTLDAVRTEHTLSLGITGFGVKTDTVNSWLYKLKEHFATFDQKVRLVNQDGKPLTSGKLFHDKVLKKGTELIVWRNGNSYLLAQTKANQKLRNYELRDRQKNFRDGCNQPLDRL